jgi:hypothetical protein
MQMAWNPIFPYFFLRVPCVCLLFVSVELLLRLVVGARDLLRAESHKPNQRRMVSHQRPIRSDHRSSSSQKHHSAVEYRCLDKNLVPSCHHSLYVASTPMLMDGMCYRLPSPTLVEAVTFWPAKSFRPCSNNNHQMAGNKNGGVSQDLISSGQTI